MDLTPKQVAHVVHTLIIESSQFDKIKYSMFLCTIGAVIHLSSTKNVLQAQTVTKLNNYEAFQEIKLKIPQYVNI